MPANAHQFRKPHVKLLALGVGYERGSSRQTVNGGIQSPAEYVVPRGTWLHRFGQRGVPERVAMGDWWIDGATLAEIDAWAKARGLSLREGVRETCYVPPEWSTLDLVVSARTTDELLAYRGRGAVVSVKDRLGQTVRNMPARGHHRAVQLFIPGLASGDVRRDALGSISFQFLPPG